MPKQATPLDHLQQVIEKAGGPTELAERIGGRTTRAHIWNWQNRDGQVPAESVIAVCRAVGYSTTPHQLRPDLYPNTSDGMPQNTAA